MADRTATRSSARLTTPQSPPKGQGATNLAPQAATRRSTRAARSESRDVSESGQGGRRGARQANVTGAEAPVKRGRKGKNVAPVAQSKSIISVRPQHAPPCSCEWYHQCYFYLICSILLLVPKSAINKTVSHVWCITY